MTLIHVYNYNVQVEQKKNLNVKFEEKKSIRKHNMAVAMCVERNKDITPAKESHHILHWVKNNGARTNLSFQLVKEPKPFFYRI